MSMSEEICYTLITISNNSEPPNELQLKSDLENGDIQVKIETLKKLIRLILSGEKFPSLLMTVIRYVLPLQDHIIKKLLLIFWEIVPKTTPDGNLLDEMILVCDAYRKDLLHPNEFIRGSTLRFLCKLKEPDLLEPLMSVIRGCLKHRHSYVRRNAVLTILTIYKNFDFLIPDAPELVANFLEVEQDPSCKRNAVLMLICENQEHALKYLCSCIDQVHSFDNTLQLVIVELIYKVCHNNPSENSRFIACIYNLLNSNSSAVCYAAARTLFTLSSSSDAVKASAGCYIKLIMDESDNTVKMIVLDQLIAMREIPAHEKVLQDLVMDILRFLTASDVEVRRKTLNLALDLISSTNVKDMVLALKKEIIKTQRSTEYEGFGKYCQLLVQTLHSCCIRFPDTASIVIPVLLDFLCDNNEQVAADVLIFVREAIQNFNQLRNMILSKLIEVFSSIKVSTIYRSALWILGEYCCSPEDIQCVMTAIRQSLGTIPIVDDEMKVVIGGRKESDPAMSSSVQKLMNTGGACVTQSFFKPKALKVEQMSLRGYLVKGDYFIAAALSSSLTKLALKYIACVADPKKQNAFIAESMIIMISVVHLGKSGLATNDISDDDFERISLCLKVLANRSPIMISIFNQQCRKSLAGMLAAKPNEKTYNIKAKEEKYITTFAADSIAFDLLARKDDTTGIENIFELSLSQAMGTLKKEPVTDFSSLKFNKITQLTGFSDPVYAEAYVYVNQCDIILDVLIINQTLDTLQNCSLELATLGDLKLVDKPAPVILGPQDFCNIKTSVKVAWTENGIIFGNIVYDICAATGDQSVVILNDIHVNIMDYIVPAVCTEQEFQEMWSEFKWENKMSINTNLVDMNAYLMHITSLTNTRCLTHGTALSGKCDFMAANLYAQSIFGEHALVNVSIEKNPRNPDDPVTGHIRIRAKTRGMVLGLGNKISLSLMSGG